MKMINGSMALLLDGSMVGMAAWSTCCMARFDGSIAGIAAWSTCCMVIFNCSIVKVVGLARLP